MVAAEQQASLLVLEKDFDRQSMLLRASHAVDIDGVVAVAARKELIGLCPVQRRVLLGAEKVTLGEFERQAEVLERFRQRECILQDDVIADEKLVASPCCCVGGNRLLNEFSL